MTKEPITIHHGEPVSQVRKIFEENDIHHLPVVNGKELIGMISWTDLMRISFGDAFKQSDKSVDVTLDHTFTIEEIMNSNPRSISYKHSVREAADILSTADFHSLPVVNGNDLVGIVTTQDLVKYLLSLY